MITYHTSYSSSCGQPSNGCTEHTDLNAALAAWRADIGSLIYRSGGSAILTEHEDGAQTASLAWCEHCEGAYPTGTGWMLERVAHIAQLADEDGERLAPDQVVEVLQN